MAQVQYSPPPRTVWTDDRAFSPAAMRTMRSRFGGERRRPLHVLSRLRALRLRRLLDRVARSLPGVRVLAGSRVGKVHPPLASRLTMRRIMATLMNVSLLCTIRS